MHKNRLAFYTAFAGIFLWYTQSVYYPKNLLQVQPKGIKAIAALLMLLSVVLFINFYGWGRGIAICLFYFSLIFSIVQLSAVYGKKYFRSFLLLIHLLFAGGLIYSLIS